MNLSELIQEEASESIRAKQKDIDLAREWTREDYTTDYILFMYIQRINLDDLVDGAHCKGNYIRCCEFGLNTIPIILSKRPLCEMNTGYPQ